MRAEQSQQFVLLGGQFALFVADGEQLLLCVEGEPADVVECRLLVLLATYTAQDGLDAEYQFLHREGLGDVVVGTQFEAFENVLLQRLGSEEDDGYLGIGRADLLCQCESVFLGHHHVEHADVELGLQESLETGLAVGA